MFQILDVESIRIINGNGNVHKANIYGLWLEYTVKLFTAEMDTFKVDTFLWYFRIRHFSTIINV